jgi:FkbM family methyltransferase
MGVMRIAKDILSRGVRLFGRELLSSEAYAYLMHRSAELDRLRRQARKFELIDRLPSEAAAQTLRYLSQSRSQFRQDLFALGELDFKREGFFVEFGATNGIDLSNTWLMEHQFGWWGILAEPARVWHASLRENRRCAIDHRCVWSETGQTLQFAEVPSAPEISTVQSFTDDDMYKSLRREHVSYEVDTISLNDLLAQHGAPRDVDFLSVDTEGSEFQILAEFDFTAYRVGVITIEHNYGPNREKTKALLESHGFVRKWPEISYVDDWYVRP